MVKKKLPLSDLKVQSFVTSLGEEQMTQLKGGHITIKGHRFNYRARWTAVDTRADMAGASISNTPDGG
jgi:hypothetical protein